MAIITLGKTVADNNQQGSHDVGVIGFRLIFPSVNNATLVNIMWRSRTNANIPVRAAVYAGGTTTNPTNATLIEDLGIVDWDGAIRHRRYTSISNPTLSAGQTYWLLFKTGTVSGVRTIYGGVTTPDFVAGYRYNMTNISTDPSVEWEATLPGTVTSTSDGSRVIISLTYQTPETDPNIGKLGVGGVISIKKTAPQQFKLTGYKGQFYAEGGTERVVTRDGTKYKEHIFTTSDTLRVSTGGTVDYVIISAGGGGGSRALAGGGGGGAGGMITGSMLLGRGTYTAIIGAGGAGAVSSVVARGTSGDQTSLTEQFGGGGGAGGASATSGTTISGLAGGSGGGVGGNTGTGTGGVGTVGQGNDGGAKLTNSNTTGGGGGGGRMTAGGIGSSSYVAGAGGSGMEYPAGSGEYYAGGGAGGGQLGSRQSGGIGGGGDGGQADGSTQELRDGIAGALNTGGGGGGGAGTGSFVGAGGNGGSGLLILQYPYL